MKKGSLPDTVLVIIIALIVIGIIFVFFAFLGDKNDTVINAIWDLLTEGHTNIG